MDGARPAFELGTSRITTEKRTNEPDSRIIRAEADCCRAAGGYHNSVTAHWVRIGLIDRYARARIIILLYNLELCKTIHKFPLAKGFNARILPYGRATTGKESQTMSSELANLMEESSTNARGMDAVRHPN